MGIHKNGSCGCGGHGGCGCGGHCACGGHGGCGSNCTCRKNQLDELITNQYCINITIATQGTIPSLDEIMLQVRTTLNELEGGPFIEVAEAIGAEYAVHAFIGKKLPEAASTSLGVYGYTICKNEGGNWVEMVNGLAHNPDEPYKLNVMIPGIVYPLMVITNANKVIYFARAK